MSRNFDAIVVGAGFSGAVLAERLASQLDWRVLVLERRPHIGGNCFDQIDQHGVLVHLYGPHIFHTDDKIVWDYLSQFTSWRHYEHQVKAFSSGNLVTFPINLNSIKSLFDENKSTDICNTLIDIYGFGSKVPILELRDSKETILRYLGDFLYRKFFLNYTAKQWGCKPEDISPEVTARVPVIIDNYDGYFRDNYQGIPQNGYTRLFERILTHSNIDILLSTELKDIITFDGTKLIFDGEIFSGKLIYTGMLDEFFSFCYGELPYRSLRFESRYFQQHKFQSAPVINYPNDYDYTRTTEFKQLTGQKCKGTTVIFEYPQPYSHQENHTNIPYYPVLNELSKARHKKYANLLESIPQIIAIGRLARFQYFNMDDAVSKALSLFKQLSHS